MIGVGLPANSWKGDPGNEVGEGRNDMVRKQSLSPADMSHAMDGAELALEQLPDEAVKTLANWWKQWYGTAGHRRLGRLLLSRRGSIPVKQYHTEVGNPSRSRAIPNVNARIGDRGLRYRLTEATLDSPAVFELREIGGEVQIVLNVSHPAFQVIEGALHEADDIQSSGSVSAVFLLLQAWAAFERQQPDGKRKYNAQEVREDWGRSARELLAASRVGAND